MTKKSKNPWKTLPSERLMKHMEKGNPPQTPILVPIKVKKDVVKK